MSGVDAALLYGAAVVELTGVVDAKQGGTELTPGAEEDSNDEIPGVTAALGRYYAISMITLAVALALGGVLQAISWSTVFLGTAGALLVGALLAWRIDERQIRSAEPSELHEDLRRHLVEFGRIFRRQPHVATFCIGLGVLNGVISIIYLWGQQQLAVVGFGLGLISFLYAGEAVVSAVSADRAAGIERRLGRRGALVAAIAVAALVLAGVASGTAIVVVVAFLLFGIADNVLDPISQSMLGDTVPTNYLAAVLSVMSVVSSLTMALASPLLGAIGQYGHIGTGFAILAVTGILAAILGVTHWFSATTRETTDRLGE